MNKNLVCSIEYLLEYMTRHYSQNVWAIAEIWYVELELHWTNNKIDYNRVGW